MSKKSVALSVCVVCLLLLCGLFFIGKQAGVQYIEDGYIYYDNSAVSALPDSQSAEFNKFELTYPSGESSIIDFVLSLCEPVSSGSSADGSQSYTSDTLSQYLYQCSEITGISTSGDQLYITYSTTDDTAVWLTYSDTGLVEKGVYTPSTDTAVFVANGTTTQHKNFRSGSYSEIWYESLGKLGYYIQQAFKNL